MKTTNGNLADGIDTEELDTKEGHLQTLPRTDCATFSLTPEAAHSNHLTMKERPQLPTVGSEKQGERADRVVDIAARQGVDENGCVCVSKGQQKRSEYY
jgi:hypothetical protein